MRILDQCVIGLVLAFAFIDVAGAEPVFSDPVYSPVTRSYFQLVEIDKGYSIRGPSVRAIGWDAARRFAQSRTFKGTHARLAIVPNRTVHTFIRDTLKPSKPAWIGLRYWCKFHALQWVTGERLKPKDYQNWDLNWNRVGGDKRSANEEAKCLADEGHYLPVHYWSVQEGFRWNANGKDKELHMVIIEFPTGAQ